MWMYIYITNININNCFSVFPLRDVTCCVVLCFVMHHFFTELISMLFHYVYVMWMYLYITNININNCFSVFPLPDVTEVHIYKTVILPTVFPLPDVTWCGCIPI